MTNNFFRIYDDAEIESVSMKNSKISRNEILNFIFILYVFVS